MFAKISIFLFSALPISLIIGNLALNLNILLLDLVLLIYCYKYNHWGWLNDKIFKLLIFFNLYLFSNSIYAYYIHPDYGYDGIFRSLGFLRFILLIYAFSLLTINQKILDKIMKIWCLILTIVILDVFFEIIFGHNILGYTSVDKSRVISFFYDEAVVGAFIFCFGFIISTYFLEKNLNFNSKIFFNIFLFLVPLSIFVSGERSNFIKSFIVFSIIIFLINRGKLLMNKKKIFLILILSFFIAIFSNNFIFIKQTEFFKRILIVKDDVKFIDKFQNIKYFAHYNVALKIFKKYPVLGTGSKNFRNECSKEEYIDEKIKYTDIRCNTHPHQIHFEILSEQGMLGYIFLLYIMLVFFRDNLKKTNLSKNIFHYAALIYLIIFFIPLLPGGSIFSSFSGSNFWIIFSIANLINKKN